jgi:hypothetical protein
MHGGGDGGQLCLQLGVCQHKAGHSCCTKSQQEGFGSKRPWKHAGNSASPQAHSRYVLLVGTVRGCWLASCFPARLPRPGGYLVLELTAGLLVVMSVVLTPDLRHWGMGPLGPLMSPRPAG